MSETTQICKPSLIVVTGRPGSGKTSLVHSLARAVRCPAICRDEIKEGFVHTTGLGDNLSGDVGPKVYEAFFDTVNLLLGHRTTLIVEAAFQHKLWAPKLEPLREIAHIRVVLCSVSPELAHSRRIERSLSDPARERFHPNGAAQAVREGRDLQIGDYDPPHLDVPMLTVDTSDGYQPDFETIVSFACA